MQRSWDRECLRERCIRQYAPIVAKNVKYHLNLTQVDPYTVESAGKREDPQEEIGIKLTS